MNCLVCEILGNASIKEIQLLNHAILVHTQVRDYKITFTEIEYVDTFLLTNSEYLEDNIFSNNSSTSFDERNINDIETNQFCCDSLESTENNE